MSDISNDSSSAMQPTGFADEVRGRQPHAIDRELSTLLQDNYVVSDVRRGMADDARDLPATWARLGKDDVGAAGLDPETGREHDCNPETTGQLVCHMQIE